MPISTEVLSKLEEFRATVVLSLREVESLDVACKSILHRHLNDLNTITSSSIIKIQAVIDFMNEKVNIGNWKEVPCYIKKTISIASYLQLIAHVKYCDELTSDDIKKLFNMIDYGIMFGWPLDAMPQLLQNCALVLNRVVQPFIDCDLAPTASEKITMDDALQFDGNPIEVIDCPSMEFFYKNYIKADKPVVLENCINHWPALTKWKDLNYFIKIAGLRTVAIELGSKYTDPDWTQKLITIEEFVKKHICQTEGPTGYLAQYQLFDHIPELKEDIREPEYCCFSETNEAVDVNIWYGPKGTLSPLHYDPKRNLLAQVVGEKQLILFSPKDSKFLYPHEHELLTTTSQVDARKPDLEKYPKYKEAKGYSCALKPGQMLYIPPTWWHCVQSLSISCSVSFWWE